MNHSFEHKEQTPKRQAPHEVLHNALAFPSRTVVHAKLEMTEPGDHDEQEADAIANDVVSGGKIARKISGGGSSSGIAVPRQMESRLSQLQGGGQPMPSNLRSKMESGFGVVFPQVRLHTDSEAASLSSSIGAKAFTHGNDIYFNQGQYSPYTTDGQRLVAHELAHVAQGGEKIGRKNFYYNGMDAPDQEYLKNQLAFYLDLRRQYISEGKHYAVREINSRIRAVSSQLELDQNVTKKMGDIKKELNKIRTKGNTHFVFAHGTPSLEESSKGVMVPRYKGRLVEATRIKDSFGTIIPWESIKKDDTIVLISCETGWAPSNENSQNEEDTNERKLSFAEALSKELPTNLIVAPKVTLYPERNQNYFTVDEGQGVEEGGGISFFLNGRELDFLSFDSFFSQNGRIDNYSSNHTIAHYFSILAGVLDFTNVDRAVDNAEMQESLDEYKSVTEYPSYNHLYGLPTISPPRLYDNE